ncbi:alpha/beta hydrolase [Nocardioides flavescens]|uniref:Alpha/beta fold hydrolase n=1 Tax=Nocardioides flavescens TaxID=2691959 RepID=A0A6L7F2T9_9ACTN|nr:alpha/beta hydrolase [Nocardioides flavescens]MXG91602.1 alpha/beta fold hydrolase [Nocardioides flavescens]
MVLLHGLGCSARTWRHLVHELDDELDCVALDLPGHGEESGSDALTVAQMVETVLEQVAELLRVRRPRAWVLAGHSMGGKVATLVAAAAEAGRPGLTPPAALVLVASSPLGVEPMEESKRAQMIGWRADGELSEQDAAEFVDANTADALPADDRAEAVADVRRVSRTAWLAWLERGSLEDWSGTGPVRTSTLVVAGGADGDLGADAQRRLVLPAVAATEVVEVPGAAHLGMLEQPAALAELVRDHLHWTLPPPDLPPGLAALLASDRVSARTRRVLLRRLAPPRPHEQVLSDAQRATLVAVVARVLPQRATDVDLADRIEADLAAGVGDGWRFADLPDDVAAWRAGLDTLAGRPGGFAELDDDAQDAVLADVVAGQVGSANAGHLSTEQMTLWFEDVRAAVVRTWVSHPAAMARIGYDGFANGGDGARKQGYLRVGAGEREPWQTLPLEVLA